MPKILLLLLIATVFISEVCTQEDSEESILCSKNFCAVYETKEGCKEIPSACKSFNGTINGIFFPSPTPCSCCNYCLETSSENEPCTLGDDSSAVPSKICGGGLSCQEKKCKPMITKCTKAQNKYDNNRKNGKLGHLQVRPECEDNGMYEPYQIVSGEIVFCVSEEGDRIFGEISEADFKKDEFHCNCSRNYHQTLKILEKDIHHVEHMRCRSSGDYDPLQCLGDYCLCVKEGDGSSINNTQSFVKRDKISNTSLECFDNKTHLEFQYFRECESEYREKFSVFKQMMLNYAEILEPNLPNCQLDGNYAPVQQNNTAWYCADPDGNVLEDFAILKEDVDSEAVFKMDCKCARARSIIKDNEKPECCKNGNYRSMQCRRGLCRCVNSDGLQIEKEVYDTKKNKLSCYISDEDFACTEANKVCRECLQCSTHIVDVELIYPEDFKSYIQQDFKLTRCNI